MGPKEERYWAYQTINFIEKNIEGIMPEDVDAYNMTLGKLFKWMLLAIQNRKNDVIRRKALKKKAREDREKAIESAEQREQRRVQELEQAHEKFKEDHREEIDAALRAEQEELNKQNDEYGEENADEEEKDQKPKEKPVMPVFEEEEFLTKWDEENPAIAIPDEVIDDIDNDWLLSEEQEDAFIAQYFANKEGQ